MRILPAFQTGLLAFTAARYPPYEHLHDLDEAFSQPDWTFSLVLVILALELVLYGLQTGLHLYICLRLHLPLWQALMPVYGQDALTRLAEGRKKAEALSAAKTLFWLSAALAGLLEGICADVVWLKVPVLVVMLISGIRMHISGWQVNVCLLKKAAVRKQKVPAARAADPL